jgi:hypothetical protein
MNGDIDFLHHLLTVITVIATVTLSLTVTHRRTETRQRRDAEGLRAVLLAELDILLGAYETCLRRLDAREETLLSCRQLIAGYRANLARLPALGAAEAGAVTRAYGFAEAIESFLAGVCKPYGQHALAGPGGRGAAGRDSCHVPGRRQPDPHRSGSAR